MSNKWIIAKLQCKKSKHISVLWECTTHDKAYTLYAPTCLSVKRKHPISTPNKHTDLDVRLAWQPVRIEMASHMTQPRLSTDKTREHNNFCCRVKILQQTVHQRKGPITRCSEPIIPGTPSGCKHASSAAQRIWSGSLFQPSTSWSDKCYWAVHKWCITAAWGRVRRQRTKEKWAENG